MSTHRFELGSVVYVRESDIYGIVIADEGNVLRLTIFDKQNGEPVRALASVPLDRQTVIRQEGCVGEFGLLWAYIRAKHPRSFEMIPKDCWSDESFRQEATETLLEEYGPRFVEELLPYLSDQQVERVLSREDVSSPLAKHITRSVPDKVLGNVKELMKDWKGSVRMGVMCAAIHTHSNKELLKLFTKADLKWLVLQGFDHVSVSGVREEEITLLVFSRFSKKEIGKLLTLSLPRTILENVADQILTWNSEDVGKHLQHFGPRSRNHGVLGELMQKKIKARGVTCWSLDFIYTLHNWCLLEHSGIWSNAQRTAAKRIPNITPDELRVFLISGAYLSEEECDQLARAIVEWEPIRIPIEIEEFRGIKDYGNVFERVQRAFSSVVLERGFDGINPEVLRKTTKLLPCDVRKAYYEHLKAKKKKK